MSYIQLYIIKSFDTLTKKHKRQVDFFVRMVEAVTSCSTRTTTTCRMARATPWCRRLSTATWNTVFHFGWTSQTTRPTYTCTLPRPLGAIALVSTARLPWWLVAGQRSRSCCCRQRGSRYVGIHECTSLNAKSLAKFLFNVYNTENEAVEILFILIILLDSVWKYKDGRDGLSRHWQHCSKCLWVNLYSIYYNVFTLHRQNPLQVNRFCNDLFIFNSSTDRQHAVDRSGPCSRRPVCVFLPSYDRYRLWRHHTHTRG